MPQDPDPVRTTLSPAIEEVVSLLSAEIRRREADGTLREVEFLIDLRQRLLKETNFGLAQPAPTTRSRENDLALIEQHSGFSDPARMSMLVGLLVAEYGQAILSDEGVARVADAMLAPAQARRRRAG